MKKLLAFVLISVLVLGTFAACSKKEETTDVGQNDGLPNSKCDNNKSDPAR